MNPLYSHNGEPSKVNIGHSSRLMYDECAYNDRLAENAGIISYRMDPNYMENCNQCLSVLGPRTGRMGQSVSTIVGHPRATAQHLTGVESVLRNLNVKTSKCKRDGVNPINLTKYGNRHLRVCDDTLNSISSRLTYPASNYRDMAINRFYNLHRNPQANIFYDFSVNTRLEAKDNFNFNLPTPWSDRSHPTPTVGKNTNLNQRYNCQPMFF